MNITRHAPGYYTFSNDHGLTGTIDKLECGWVVRMDGAMYNYSDPVETYREAKHIAATWETLH